VRVHSQSYRRRVRLAACDCGGQPSSPCQALAQKAASCDRCLLGTARHRTDGQAQAYELHDACIDHDRANSRARVQGGLAGFQPGGRHSSRPSHFARSPADAQSAKVRLPRGRHRIVERLSCEVARRRIRSLTCKTKRQKMGLRWLCLAECPADAHPSFRQAVAFFPEKRGGYRRGRSHSTFSTAHDRVAGIALR